jgi:hypothetical protein
MAVYDDDPKFRQQQKTKTLLVGVFVVIVVIIGALKFFHVF